MSDVDENLLDKVRKLLAKAEAEGVTPEEAEALNGKAAELIAKYGIDRARLAAEKPGTDRVGRKTIRLDPPFALDKAELLWAVSMPLRVEGIRQKYWGQRPDGREGYLYRMVLIGWESDIERVELLFTSLLLQSAHELTRVAIPWGEDAAAYRRSWLAGFSAIVRRRLAQAEQQAQASAEAMRPAAAADSAGPSVALVLADRSLAVKSFREQEFGDVKTAKRRKLNGSGLFDGVEAGRRANLHTNRTVGRRTAGAIA